MSYTRYDVPNESGNVLSGLSLYYDSMYVGSGGTVLNTTVDYYSYMIVSEGGVVQNTTVNSYGSMNIYSSGVAQNTIVNNGVLNIYSSGVADNTTLNGHGGIEISPGGTATGVTLNPGTILYINSGGTALNIAENGGEVLEYGSASFVPNTFSDVVLNYGMSATVHSGTTALRTTVNSHGGMNVIGGSADSTTITSDGYVTVGNGGLVNHTTIGSGASMYLYTSSGWKEQGIDATTASNTTVLSDGVLYLSSGAVADGINVAGSGRVFVSSGATATGIVAESGAGVHFWIALDTVVTGTSGGTAFALSDGKISDLKIDSGNGYGVESGATATNPVVQAGGSLYVYDYGSAVGIIEDGGYVVVSAYGAATFTPHEFSGAVLKQYQSATVHSGTTATDVTVSCCVMHVYSSGVVNGATVSGGVDEWNKISAGRVVLSSGAIASGVITADGLGRVQIANGATIADGTKLVENGGAFVLDEGVEVAFSPNSFSNQTLQGMVTVHSGTTATDIVISNGSFDLYEGGSAFNVNLGRSGYYDCSGVVHSNAVASGLSGRNWTIEGGAVVYDLNGGGKIAGTVSGASVTGAVSILNGGRMVSAIAPYIDGMGYGITIENGASLEKSVLNGGYGYASSGATVTDLTVTAGTLYVYTGATADELDFSGGTLSVAGGSVTNLKITENVYLWLRVDPTTGAFVSGTMDDSTPILLKDGRFEHFSANRIGLSIANGGEADDITFENGQITVSAGGTATNFNVSSGGEIVVSVGGTLTNATFHGVKDSWGNYYSSAGAILGIEGGEANSITLEGGRVSMTAGTLQDVNVNGGHMWVYGGTAKNAVVSSGGSVVAGYTGALENVMLADLGYMSLCEGAKAIGTVLSAVQVNSSYEGHSWIEDRGGYLNVSYGGIASDTTVGSGCQIWVNYGGIASGATVSSGGYMYLGGYGSDYYGYYPLSWGVADDVTVNSGGSIEIYGGASATNLKLEDGARATITLVSSAGLGGTLVQGTYAGSAFEVTDGHMTDFGATEKGLGIAVCSGGVLDAGKETRIVDGASLSIETGGVVQGAERITVEQGGSLYIGGGEFTGKIKESGGYVYIYNSGYGDGTPIEFEENTFTGLTLVRQRATVHSGTVASKTKLLVDYEDPHTSSYYDAHMAVYSGGLAYDTDVAGGYLEVCSGGSAFRTVVHSSGYVYIVDAFANDVTLEDAARLEIWGYSAAVSGVTMKGDSVGMTVGSNATVTSTVISGGSVTVLWDALASHTSVGDGAGMTVSDGGKAVDVTIAKGGKLFVENNGFVSGLTSVGGEVSVGYSGTLTGDTQVADGGKVVVSGYSSFLDGQATVYGGGTVSVESDGTIAAAITVKAGGGVSVGAGGWLTGQLTVETGAEISVGAGGWLTGQLTVETGATVAMAEGSFYSFDISGISEPSDQPLLNDYSVLSGDPGIAITVSPYGQTHGTYILADNAAGFDETVNVYYDYYGSRYALGEISLDSGSVQFGDDFYTLTLSEENRLVLTVGDYIADNGPDGGWNNVDKLWDKKAKKPVSYDDGGIYYSGATILDKYYTSPIPLDKPLTIDQSFVEHDGENITYNNFVGKITGGGFDPDTDDSDCGKFVLNTGARLSFNVTARTAGKFVIYKITETPDKKDPSKTNYSLKKIQTTSISVKKKTSYSTVSTKAVYLEAGTYFLSMETKINKKKDTECFYNVELNYAGTAKKPGAKFYSAGDNSWNNYLYDSKTKTLNPSYFYTVSPGTGSYAVAIDNNSYYDSNTGRSWRNFVGFGDKTDFARLKPSSPVKLNFTVTATDASTFTVWSLTVKGKDKKTGNTLYAMKALKTIKLKKGEGGLYSAPANELLLDRLSSSEDSNVGYYISMQSTSRNKDTEAYYDASVDSYAFQYADSGDNKYLYDKKADPAHYNSSLYSNHVVAGAEPGRLMLETGGSLGVSREAGEEYKTYDNFVGFGDEWDYAEIELTSPGTCTFTVDAYSEGTVEKASPGLKFMVYSLTRVVKGETVTWKQKTLTSQTIAVKDQYVSGEPVKKTLEIKEATSDDVKYFVSMQSTGAKKGAEVFYNVTLGLTPPPDASALAMPETDSHADSLAMPDSLSFGQYDADALADASASSLADLDDKSAWQSLLA